MCLCSRGTSASVCGHIYRLCCCCHPRKKQYFQLPFPACYNNEVPGWRVKNESGISKISSILICQRYVIDSLFQKFDTCFVVFTETFLVLYFFRLLLLEHSRLFSSREFLFFLDNPKMIQMLSILGEKLVWRKKKKHSNQVNPQVSPKSLSRTQATTTYEEASSPTPPTKGHRVSPISSKVSDEYSSKY